MDPEMKIIKALVFVAFAAMALDSSDCSSSGNADPRPGQGPQWQR